MKKKIQALLETADRLFAASNDEYISEQAQDEAYTEYHNTVTEIAEALQQLTSGAIDSLTAKRMAHFKRNEIKTLLKRWAA